MGKYVYGHSREFEDADAVDIIVNLFMCILIVTCNILLLLTLRKRQRLHTYNYSFIASLAVNGFLYAGVLFLHNFRTLVEKLGYAKEFKPFCLTYLCLLLTSCIEFSVVVVLLAFDRLIFNFNCPGIVNKLTTTTRLSGLSQHVHRYRHRRRKNFSKRQARVMIAGSWVFAIVFGFSPFVWNDYDVLIGCNPSYVFNTTYLRVLVYYYMITAGLVGLICICIHVKLSRDDKTKVEIPYHPKKHKKHASPHPVDPTFDPDTHAMLGSPIDFIFEPAPSEASGSTPKHRERSEHSIKHEKHRQSTKHPNRQSTKHPNRQSTKHPNRQSTKHVEHSSPPNEHPNRQSTKHPRQSMKHVAHSSPPNDHLLKPTTKRAHVIICKKRDFAFFCLVYAVFYSCWTPLLLLFGLQQRLRSNNFAYQSALVIPGFNAACNTFIILLIMKRDFRETFIQLIRRKSHEEAPILPEAEVSLDEVSTHVVALGSTPVDGADAKNRLWTRTESGTFEHSV